MGVVQVQRTFPHQEQELALAKTSDRTSASAEAVFKKEQQRRDGEKAMAESRADLVALRERTGKLRARGLARDAAVAGRRAPAATKPQMRSSQDKAKRSS